MSDALAAFAPCGCCYAVCFPPDDAWAQRFRDEHEDRSDVREMDGAKAKAIITPHCPHDPQWGRVDGRAKLKAVVQDRDRWRDRAERAEEAIRHHRIAAEATYEDSEHDGWDRKLWAVLGTADA